MKRENKNYRNSTIYRVFFLNLWVIALIIGSVLLILVATLSPFDFTPSNLSLQENLSQFAVASSLNDLIGNILLFMPFGFACSCYGAKRKLSLFQIIIGTVLISAALSFTVEILQLFLPSRKSDYTDLITNSIGGLLGAIAYWFWSFNQFSRRWLRLTRSLESMLFRKLLAATLIIWVVFTCFVALSLQNGTYLSNWNPEFPLLTGNEVTGDRPWQGTVTQLAIAERAISPSEVAEVFAHRGFVASQSLVANYSLNGKDNYRDLSDRLPNLVWQGNPPLDRREVGVDLTKDYWLSTPTAATKLAQKIRQSSQFTIETIVATTRPKQGMSRIISFSSDPFHRNFTIAHEGSDLVFRLRTQITGENGVYTGLGVPDFFQDGKLHHLIFTYDRSMLQLYVDRPEQLYRVELTPEIILFRYFFPFEGNSPYLTKFSLFILKILYYLLFFAPIGILLALLYPSLPKKLNYAIALVMGGIIFPALILELLIREGNDLRVNNLVLSIAIATITMLLVRSGIEDCSN